MPAIYKLYGRAGSGSMAVQVMLEELGTPYERIWVGRDPADVDRFRSTNPTGRVPALEFPDGSVMFESAAMLIHLAGVNPQAGLAPPTGTSRHATFLQWMIFLSANVYESVLRIYYPARYTSRGEADADVVRQQGIEDYGTHLAIIGHALGPYVLGADYSIADVYLYMLVSWYPGEKAELFSRIPALRELVKRVGERPAVIKVDADHA